MKLTHEVQDGHKHLKRYMSHIEYLIEEKESAFKYSIGQVQKITLESDIEELRQLWKDLNKGLVSSASTFEIE